MLHAIFITLPFLTCLFWLSVLLLEKNPSYPKKILVVFMAASTVLFFGHLAFYGGATEILPVTDTLYIFGHLAVYPLYYLYICALTEIEPLDWKRWWVLMAAVLFMLALGLVNLGLLPESAAEPIRQAGNVIFAIQLVLVAWFGLKKISWYEKKLKTFYSETEELGANRVKLILICFICTSIVSFVANVIGREFFTGSEIPLYFASFTFSALLFFVGYGGYTQDVCAADLKDEMKVEEDKKQNYEVLQKRIIKFIEEEKLYLRPNLKVSDAAAEMGTNRNYVYNAINVGMGVSFNDLINGYRVEYAKELLRNNSGMTIREVGIESGFSSDASLFRNFSHFAGTTPERWRKKFVQE